MTIIAGRPWTGGGTWPAGPIPVSVAERIAAGAASWSRVLTHPLTGTVLDHDRTAGAVPADLRRRLRASDGTCRFPGCRQVRRRGPGTSEGVLGWTSPAGRVHVTYPQGHHHPVLSPLRIHDDVPVAPPPPPASSTSGSPTSGSPPSGSPPF